MGDQYPNAEPTTDAEEEPNRSLTSDGRTVKMDTGFYCVEVHGDPDDSLQDVKQAAFAAADRIRADVEEMDDRFDNGDARTHH